MYPIINWITSHPVQSTLAAKAIWDSIVGSLPAPTKDSSQGYVFTFKFLNSLAFNFHRAKSTAIENSPNFLAAVQNYIANLPGSQNAPTSGRNGPNGSEGGNSDSDINQRSKPPS